MSQLAWDDIVHRAHVELEKRQLPKIYADRLDFEVSEIDKQAANSYWLELVNNGSRFDSNPNGLVLPWLLGMVDVDPIKNRSDPIVTTSSYAKIMKLISECGKLPPEIIRDADNPDIDIDCLPEARDPIKDYVVGQYSAGINDDYGAVCSVGTWMTYLLRSAIKDVAKATNLCDPREAELLSKELPDEVDELKDNGESVCKNKDCAKVHREAKCPYCGSPDTEYPTIGRLLEEHAELRSFYERYPLVIDLAVRLIGRIRAMSKHAGALIIADRPLFGNIPMAFDTNTMQWKSLWSEGRNTQLSKFGYMKWDVLGLKNLRYIYEASRMIQQNHGIHFGELTQVSHTFTPGHKVHVPSMAGWDYSDPELRHAGYYYTRTGDKVFMDMDDPAILDMASEARTDAVFQFDTSLAKRILSNKVKSFDDLMIFNAMGHPGPMAMIPDYVARRDDPYGEWRKDVPGPILEVLSKTHGTICYQEQLQRLWQIVAGFTAPEAQEARKAVAKKWKDKLAHIGEKWLRGASAKIGEEQAKIWWDKQISFGRYAFNMSHSVSYCLVAYHCLWLKTYFPHEWWASVMSYCNAKKLVRYMNVARGEGIKFAPMDINNLTLNFVAIPDKPRNRHDDPPNGYVVPGLICLKGVGEKAAASFTGETTVRESDDDDDLGDCVIVGPNQEIDTSAQYGGQITSLDDFVGRNGKHKILLERLIKLGSFKKLPGHECSKAVWIYYQCKYCSGKEITQLKAEVRQKILAMHNWTDENIAAERKRQESEFRTIYPKRKVPQKIINWQPKPEITLAAVTAAYQDDFTLAEILQFEEEFLGYHLHSPLDLYQTKGGRSITAAKEIGEVEAVIAEPPYYTETRTGSKMCKLTLTDGIQTATLILWSNELAIIDKNMIRQNRGIRAKVNWDQQRKNFTLRSGSTIVNLKLKEA